jgi:hypothetical protein
MSWPAYSGVDYAKTTARVTFEAKSFWVDEAGPVRTSSITVQGEINRDTIAMIKENYEFLAKIGAINLNLDTLGGSVDAALEIGRCVREKEINVMVLPNATCASSCVFILAGGVTRHVDGKVGIHRPYIGSLNVPVTADYVKQASVATKELLRGYFLEMNISERLADDMMMIPSDKMVWLDRREIAVYGLGEDDPVIKETQTLKATQKYGLSRTEYEARWRRALTLCNLTSESDCVDKILRTPGSR